MSGLASLPMYDRSECRDATDRYWAGIRDLLRAAGIAAPEALRRDGDIWDHWQASDLVLSQTCGLPYRSRLHGRVTLVGTPDFGVEGCPPGYYRSVLVARADDPRDGFAAFGAARFAYNDGLSQSGWGAAWDHACAEDVTLTPVGPTGGHRLSALAVAEGRADLAAIDAVTWRLLTRWEPWTAGLRVVGQTRPTPGLPYVCAKGGDGAAVLAAVRGALAALSDADRSLLGIRGIVDIPAAEYLAVPVPPAP